MNIQTSKLNALWLVTSPYRSDLNAFVSDVTHLENKLFELSTGYVPIVYEVQFWLKTPKFKKLTKTQLKKILDFNLGEKSKNVSAIRKKTVKKYKK